jgi:spore germination protein KC
MTVLCTGCWNYREVEKLAIASGLAIDKIDDEYLVTIEIVDIKGGRDSKISTRLVSTEGSTIFDAVRKSIKTAGKRLYFGHAEVVIVSTEIAEEGMIPVMDWIGRDAELRNTLHFLISKEKSAKEILEQQPMTSDVLSFQLNDMLLSQKNLSYAQHIEEWQFVNDLGAMGISSTLPTIDLTTDSDKLIPEITGTAVFKEDKLIGFLNGEETKTMLFIKDKIKGGLLVNKEYDNDSATNISLEIFKNKTKQTLNYANGKITIVIDTNTDVTLGENGGVENYIEEPGQTKLKNDFEEMLESNIKSLVKKTQEQYDSDIFGFGKTVKLSMPDLWKQIEPKWSQIYKDVKTEVHSTINIKNSAFQSKPVKAGD